MTLFDARTLANSLGCLPLALDHAAAYCKRTQVGFADYATRASTLIANAPRDVMYPQSVAATFDLAIGEAESSLRGRRTGDGVPRLLRASCVFPFLLSSRVG